MRGMSDEFELNTIGIVSQHQADVTVKQICHRDLVTLRPFSQTTSLVPFLFTICLFYYLQLWFSSVKINQAND